MPTAKLLRRHHPDTRTPEDDDAHDLALREVLNAYADLQHRTRRDRYKRDQPIRHPHQPVDIQTQHIVVLGHVDASRALSPTWVGHYGNEAARPSSIKLLIAFLEAVPHDTC